MVRYGLVFAFSEANHAVFQNAGIDKWKKTHPNDEFWVYTPNEYAGLYYSADKVIIISQTSFEMVHQRYKNFFKPVYRNKPITWLSAAGLNAIHHKFLSFLPLKIFHKLPERFKHDHKSRKYLFDSGIYQQSKEDFLQNSKFYEKSMWISTAIYFDIGTMSKLKKNLLEYFEISFKNLYDQILSRSLYKFSKSTPTNNIYSHFKISKSQRIIFLRTRNISNDVEFQNAIPSLLKPLVLLLIDLGYFVVNSGIPATYLGIRNENYIEYSHSLTVDEEFELIIQSDFLLQTAWSGLFSAVAALNIPLITFDLEWSAINFQPPISLLDARKAIGLSDLPLGRLQELSRDQLELRLNTFLKN